MNISHILGPQASKTFPFRRPRPPPGPRPARGRQRLRGLGPVAQGAVAAPAQGVGPGGDLGMKHVEYIYIWLYMVNG